MSCYEMNKVLRVPVSSLDMREFWNGVKSRFDRIPEDELEDDFRWYISETYPNTWSELAEAGKFSFPLTEDQVFVDFVLEHDWDSPDGEYGKTRALSAREADKYKCKFEDFFSGIDMSKVRLVQYSWYNSCEAPGYYSEMNDPFYREV